MAKKAPAKKAGRTGIDLVLNVTMLICCVVLATLIAMAMVAV